VTSLLCSDDIRFLLQIKKKHFLVNPDKTLENLQVAALNFTHVAFALLYVDR